MTAGVEGDVSVFELGINYPWVSCGHDFGPKPPAWAGARGTDWSAVEGDLNSMRELGLGHVRWWLLGGGVNLPCGITPEQVATRQSFGPRFPPAAERWVPHAPLPPIPVGFLEDFERLLQACERSGVALWPSLCSFESFLPIEQQAGEVTSRGRGAMLLHPSFFPTYLEPLLDLCGRYPAAVTAFEICNEPGWALREGWLSAEFGRHAAWVTREAMSEFLIDGVGRVAERGLRATIGFLDSSVPWLSLHARSRLRALAARGLYLHQHHHYPGVTGVRTLPPAWRSAIQPVWVGEVSTSQHGRWHDAGLAENDEERFLAARIALIESRGYAGALLWARRAGDPHVRWDEVVRAQLRAVHGARAAATPRR